MCVLECVCARVLGHLCGLDELVNEVDCVLTAVRLTHHHGNPLGTDAVVCSKQKGQRSKNRAV